MNIDTEAIRRLRDSLLARDHAAAQDTPRAISATLQPAQRDALLRRIEPFAETMYLVMMADAEASTIERQALFSAFDVLTGGAVDAGELHSLLERFGDTALREGSEARLQQIGVRLAADREDRETAYTLAAVVALADARVEPGENRLLEWVQEYYGVSDRRATILLESVD